MDWSWSIPQEYCKFKFLMQLVFFCFYLWRTELVITFATLLLILHNFHDISFSSSFLSVVTWHQTWSEYVLPLKEVSYFMEMFWYVVSLELRSFHCKSFRRIMKSIRHNQVFVLNSLKRFRMNYKRVITSSVSETTLHICSESTSLCGETTSTVFSTFGMNKVVIRLNRSLKTYHF